MKKLFTLAMGGLLMLSLVSCGSENVIEELPKAEQEAAETKLNEAIKGKSKEELVREIAQKNTNVLDELAAITGVKLAANADFNAKIDFETDLGYAKSKMSGNLGGNFYSMVAVDTNKGARLSSNGEVEANMKVTATYGEQSQTQKMSLEAAEELDFEYDITNGNAYVSAKIPSIALKEGSTDMVYETTYTKGSTMVPAESINGMLTGSGLPELSTFKGLTLGDVLPEGFELPVGDLDIETALETLTTATDYLSFEVKKGRLEFKYDLSTHWNTIVSNLSALEKAEWTATYGLPIDQIKIGGSFVIRFDANFIFSNVEADLDVTLPGYGELEFKCALQLSYGNISYDSIKGRDDIVANPEFEEAMGNAVNGFLPQMQ